MAAGNFTACLGVTLPHEGGWSDHPKDPGGATMKGITLAVFRKRHPNATKADLRAISDAEVQHIYFTGYWSPLQADRLAAGVDLAVFDFGVNSGVSRSAKYLQSAVGVAQDGKIGNATLGAAAGKNAATLVKAICAKRLGFVRGLSTFSTFGKGWSRRIADVEARGVKMAGASSSSLLVEAHAAAGKAKDQNSAAAGTGAGGVAGGLSLDMGDVNMWIVVGVCVVAAVAMALIKSRSMINKDRAEAYAKVANGD